MVAIQTSILPIHLPSWEKFGKDLGGSLDTLTLECGRIPKALFSARWLKCSSVLRGKDQNILVNDSEIQTGRIHEGAMVRVAELGTLGTPGTPGLPEAAVGAGHHVVEDVEGGLSFRSSAHPQLLQQHRLEGNSGSGSSLEPGPGPFPSASHLDGGGGHLPGLVEVQRHHVREAAGVAVHGGGAVPEGLQDGVDRLPLLGCVGKTINVRTGAPLGGAEYTTTLA